MITLAVILARKDSKRLKNKNRLKINGTSLVERAIKFAASLTFIDKIIFSTNDNYFLKKNKNSRLITINRPKKLSHSNSRSEDAILHAVERTQKKLNFKNIMILLLQPTSPFRSKKIITKMYNKIKSRKNTSLISVSPLQNKKKIFYSIQKGILLKSTNKNKEKNFFPNGNFYFAKYTFLKKNRSFYCKNKTLPYIITNKKLKIDIDTKKDFNLAKRYS